MSRRSIYQHKGQSVAPRRTTKTIEVEMRPIEDRRGPTAQRLAEADSYFAIGGAKTGSRIYQFHDSTLDRLYSRLTKSAKTLADQEMLRREYIGLQRYKHHWYHAGLLSQLSSSDPGRIFASDPGSMSGMAKSEKQAHHRQQYRNARKLLGHRAGIVVDNVVCAEQSLEIAGYSVGWPNKPQAISAATEVVRDAGARMAEMWGIG
jgi:hypothetical protein